MKKHCVLVTGWLPCTADGKNAKGRQQSYWQGYTKAKKSSHSFSMFLQQCQLGTVCTCVLLFFSTYTPADIPCYGHMFTHTKKTYDHTQRTVICTQSNALHHTAHPHGWVIFRKITGLALFFLFFPQSREYFVEAKVLHRGRRNRGLRECCVKYIWETDGKNAGGTTIK